MRILILTAILSLVLIAEDELKFGVFPHMPLMKLHEVYDTVGIDLQEQIGKPVILMTKPYYRQYKDELNRGLYELAFIQPLDYVQAHKLQGYIPIARRSKDLKAIMVVLKASNYDNVSDVTDKIIASAPAEAAVTQMMLTSMKKEGHRVLDEFTISYSKNHFVCLQKVVDGEAAACITAERAMSFFNQEKKIDSFKVIYETKPLPHALFVVHPRVPKETREVIQKRILNWGSDSKGRLMLKKGRLLNFIKATDSDYDVVREFMDMKKP